MKTKNIKKIGWFDENSKAQDHHTSPIVHKGEFTIDDDSNFKDYNNDDFLVEKIVSNSKVE